jgi:hypothetical protein
VAFEVVVYIVWYWCGHFPLVNSAGICNDHSMKSLVVLAVCVGQMRSENENLGHKHATYKKPVYK